MTDRHTRYVPHLPPLPWAPKKKKKSYKCSPFLPPQRKSSQTITSNLQCPWLSMETWCTIWNLLTGSLVTNILARCYLLASFFMIIIMNSLFKVLESQFSPPSWYFTLAPTPKLTDLRKALHSSKVCLNKNLQVSLESWVHRCKEDTYAVFCV